MFDTDDDLPGYLTDAFKTAIEKGLLSLTLTRIGTETRMWQASTRFPRSTGYHVEIEPDALQAAMKALGAWARTGAPAPAGFCDEPDEPANPYAEEIMIELGEAPADTPDNYLPPADRAWKAELEQAADDAAEGPGLFD
jgi:hypothetical protein